MKDLHFLLIDFLNTFQIKKNEYKYSEIMIRVSLVQQVEQFKNLC